MSSAPLSTRNRQIGYALAILLLFVAMFQYTNWLNGLRARKQLGEATIGQIDTGSFMLKLALLGGARGVAANVLWTRANDLQKLHEWDKLDQTVNMITKLQPHFLSVWTFQSWNLAYNVSVEWDDPADKYQWIKKGIEFVKDGTQKNQKSPDLLWDTAWYYYHKLGFSDEAVILRKLLRDDDDEDFKLDPNADFRTVLNDNFQLARGWFTRSVDLVDDMQGERVGGGTREEEVALATDVTYVDAPPQKKGRPGDIVFRTMPAHAQTRYSVAMEKKSVAGDVEPRFGDEARNAWEESLAEWVKFGTHPFPSHSHPDQLVRIDDVTDMEKYATLTDPQQYWTERWSNDTNYRYWKDRSLAESTRQGVEGRRLFYEATMAQREANFPTAVEKYKAGLELWANLLEEHPSYREDDLSRRDMGELVRRYANSLRQLGEELPEDTPFYDIYQMIKDEEPSVDPFDAMQVLGRRSRPSN